MIEPHDDWTQVTAQSFDVDLEMHEGFLQSFSICFGWQGAEPGKDFLR